MIYGFWLFLGQITEFIADLWELPSSLLRSIAYFFYGISGINGNGDEEQ